MVLGLVVLVRQLMASHVSSLDHSAILWEWRHVLVAGQ